MYAAYNGHVDICKLLIMHGADTKCRDKDNKTVFELCGDGLCINMKLWSSERTKILTTYASECSGSNVDVVFVHTATDALHVENVRKCLNQRHPELNVALVSQSRCSELHMEQCIRSSKSVVVFVSTGCQLDNVWLRAVDLADGLNKPVAVVTLTGDIEWPMSTYIYISS